MNRSLKVLPRIALLTAVFAFGYLAGSTTDNRAEAQFGDALKAAGAAAAGNMAAGAGSEGMLGSAMKLGTSITEMQESVNTLQRNIEILQGIKASITGS